VSARSFLRCSLRLVAIRCFDKVKKEIGLLMKENAYPRKRAAGDLSIVEAPA
jgi:hypothetical protein